MSRRERLAMVAGLTKQACTRCAPSAPPLFDLSREDFCTPGVVFLIGVVPSRIDILTEISGVSFEEAWAGRFLLTVDRRGLPFIGSREMIANKRASGRPKDLADGAELEAKKTN